MICAHCAEHENEDNGPIKPWSKILRLSHHSILHDDMLREAEASLHVSYFGIMEYNATLVPTRADQVFSAFKFFFF